MAKFTDQEIIKHYELQKQTLIQELTKIEAVLSALRSNGRLGNQAPVKKRSYTRRKPAGTPAITSNAKKAQASKASTEKTITIKNTSSKGEKKSMQKRPASPAPTGESGSKDNWDNKIQNALSQLGSGTKERIVEFIADKDPAASPEKISKALTLRLAILLKGRKLQKEAAGNQYRLA